jgi:uncharacterized protein YdeI (YjbR/CyaY-like superfamily)
MESFKDIPVQSFSDAVTWETWLRKNVGLTTGVWIKIPKKSTGIPTVDHDGALDVALCYGWIDGQSQSIDDTHYLQRFLPRRPRSTWSKRNVAKVAELTAAGRMQPSGQAEIDAAKQDGRWDMAYDSPKNMAMLDDFKAALDASPKALEFYSTLNKTNTYAFLWRIQTAKKPETRAARIQKSIQMLEDGKTYH